MARYLTPAVIMLVIIGCASNGGLVSDLPSPNFNGPVVQSTAPTPISSPLVNAPVEQMPVRRGMPMDRAWIPSSGARPWKWIVVHHSATPAGSATRFDRHDREVRHWDELGYHFVIGNGTDTRDGLVEVGSRWPKQKWGAHAKTPDNRFNDFGIGICLVGNFEIERPSPRQLESLARLVAYLQATYRIPQERIIGHGTVHSLANGGTITDCPGRYLNVLAVRRMAMQNLADAGESILLDEAQPAAGTELIGDVSAE